MDEDLYDEFGNYIGPDLDDDEDDWDDDEDMEDVEDEDEDAIVEDATIDPGNAIVLHEDKKYYPNALEVYGNDVEVTIQEEDNQRIDEPIIKPIVEKKWALLEDVKEGDFPPTTYTKKFYYYMTQFPNLMRSVTFAGALHHGKTSLADLLVHQTHEFRFALEKKDRFTDTRLDEQQRGISIKANPVTLLLPDSRGKTFMINLMDTPGHVNFLDEVAASMRISDGVVLVVDAIEGVAMQTEKILKAAIQERQAIVVVINKIDRLVLELKLPPADAYFKLKHTIDTLNEMLIALDSDIVLDPKLGNVTFAASEQGFSFTLFQYAELYSNSYGIEFDTKEFADRLWGDIYFDERSGKFVNERPSKTSQKTFVQFVLDPIYKLISSVVGEDAKVLKGVIAEVGIHLNQKELQMNVRPLLKLVMRRFFGTSTGIVDMLVEHVPSPEAATKKKVESTYTGDMDTDLVKAMVNCDPEGPLMINIVKNYPDKECDRFYCFGRILSGTVKKGMDVKVLGERYSPEDEEDMALETIENIYLCNSRYNMQIDELSAGNWVLLEGIDRTVVKTATITSADARDVCIFRNLRFPTESVVKIAVEPVNPSDLPKMLDALRKIDATYPLCTTKVEDSGEHVIRGTGELYLDSIMYDMRRLFSDIEIKVADPVVKFCETVVETSSIKCYADTLNKQNQLTMISEPLEKGLGRDIEDNKVKITWDRPVLQKWFQKNYDWDILAARNIWAFGPDKEGHTEQGANVLLNDTLPAEVSHAQLNSVKPAMIAGFQWATREGPLCEEPIRNVKFKILHAEISQDPISRGVNQITPTARRVVYSSFLTATPRLMEPVYAVEIQAPYDAVSSIYNVLAKRRGHPTGTAPIAGSPLHCIKAFLPVIDSFGFETDLRSYTQGQAYCQSVFDHWAIVPGDPLDKSILLRPLEPSPPPHLARDFMVKTRRRKGLTEDVSISKFFDEDLLLGIAQMDIDLSSYL